MKKEQATEIIRLMLECTARINESIRLVQQSCSEDEFNSYRKAGGTVIAAITLDILEPIYKGHPDLKPY